MGNAKWQAVSKKLPCGACGDVKGWCTVNVIGMVFKCKRCTSEFKTTDKNGEVAYLHPFNRLQNIDPRKMIAKAVESKPRMKVSEVKAKMKEFRLNLTSQRLESAAKQLNLSKESLSAFGIGFCTNPEAFSFPMYGGDAKACGIRLRMSNGKKLCVPGSQNGLFVPTDFDASIAAPEICDDPFPLLILLPEGPTDAAAARDLGFRAIGRPSNSGGALQLQRFLAERPKQDVVVIADNDKTKFTKDGVAFWPGIEGALHLCRSIIGFCGRLRFMLPPDGAKDLREWLATGDTALFAYAISKSSVVTQAWMRAANARLEAKRKTENKPQEQRVPA